jgi:serine/threonine-protein kinase HipA
MRKCVVYIKGIKAGILEETEERKYVFTYLPEYMTVHPDQPVCLAMPVREDPYQSDHLFPYFYNMLSEGANRRMQSMLLHIDEQDDFGILIATAQTDTIGSVTVKPIGQDEG